MNYRQELKYLVKYVKEKSKEQGIKLTQKSMGETLGFKNEAYLSQLLTGKENVNEGHILKFKKAFKQYLPNDAYMNNDDRIIINTTFEVVLKEIAKLKGKVNDVDPEGVLTELKQEIRLSVPEKRNRIE